MRTSLRLAILLSVAVAARARAADAPPPGGVADLEGPRTLGLSAGIGAAAGNEGIYLNPAAIAARKRYSIEAGGLWDRRGSDTADRFLGGSIVDSESSPMTAGVSYQRVQEHGSYTGGNLVHLALAGPVAQGFYVGLTGKWIDLSGQTFEVGGPPPVSTKVGNVSAITADAGVLWQVADLVSLGITGYNLVPISTPGVAPLGMGAGVAIGSDRSFQVLADWRTDFDHRNLEKGSNRFSVGAEALLGDLVAVRAGYMKDDILDTNWWSAGVGIVTQVAALDFGYRQSTSDSSARMLGATLKLFVNTVR